MKNPNLHLPYRFHIGTQKAASTFFYHWLKQNSSVSVSPLQEINFFDHHFEKGLDWYNSVFAGKGARIDTSPKYFMRASLVAPRIYSYQKEVLQGKRCLFLLILRNPADYVFSHFQMQFNQGFFKKISPQRQKIAEKGFEEYIKHYPGFLNRGKYFSLLSEWLKYFDLSQFKIIIFENFVRQPEKWAKEIADFWRLPLNSNFSQISGSSRNKMLKYSWLARVRQWTVKRQWFKHRLQSSRVFNYFYDRLLTTTAPERLSPPMRQYLENEFEPQIKQLEKLLSINLGGWKKTSKR
ncbi:hypothetical protein D6821_00210 [Candidatus Parcubacteria bacterium]|nr:MAG: hypothetical protein D6821_00210 [Candidatus Parcubacteria bacterium]